MSLDRVVSLYKPFFYKQHATPFLTRTICIFLTIFCLTLAVLPFAGVGKYKFNQSSRSFCQFDWFPVTLPGTVYILAIAACGVVLISLMTLSNIIVLIIVVRIRRRMSAVLPSELNARRRARRVAFCQEERMAKFVALVSIVFLVTWLPVTVRACVFIKARKQIKSHTKFGYQIKSHSISCPGLTRLCMAIEGLGARLITSSPEFGYFIFT